MLTVVHDENESNEHAPAAVGGSMLDELAREGARRMLAAALQAEVAAYIEQCADELDADGRRLVVRNGYHQPREVATAAGAVPVRAPRVNDKRVDPETGERLEPIEDVMIDVDDEFSGIVIEKLSARKAELTDMGPSGAGKTRIQLKCPSRSLIGYQGEFLTDTRGSGVLRLTEGGWKIEQYVLSFAVPNERARAVVDAIKAD